MNKMSNIVKYNIFFNSSNKFLIPFSITTLFYHPDQILLFIFMIFISKNFVT